MPEERSWQVWNLVKTTASEWVDHSAPRLGAALAYYSLLSMAPLLILIVAIFGLVFDKSTAQHQLLSQVQEVVGGTAAKGLQGILESAHHSGSGIVASTIAIVTLLFGASGVFSELRDSLNTIWDAPARASATIRSLVWQRLVSFAMVLALGFLLLASLLVSAGIALLSRFYENYLPLRAA